ncbi:Glycerophosphoryl diester phosphodiesterase [Thalassovita gelatinovora]|uniref:Glycerophosphoryl diester phosphodiesterase n=1 Tax=Thalassovita gelatinovora TaxID=53501 RepID=A0A0P1FPF6_THAGE|nr:glycerophosphodiester phosphodiesterase family protein [Thalassovita gelatinovora]QIZ80793.1 phosphodiesterase [Thalassovita gelatinovora]CUH63179.1 Glycerophosphoryl diester phosphodiesterase [Thalassovita gelatinovora]SEQ63026.1 Glycerophosphoryl diester phosphodiesterase [Thalassovita gelatinovora]
MTRLPEDFLRRPIAHRALHDVVQGRAENSPAAIAAAINAGYGIEIDLQLSADGQAIVFHDYDLTRLTGEPGPIQRRTAEDLGRITLLGGTDTVPTLRQVLDQVAGQVPLLIEIKDQDGVMGANVGKLEAAAAAALQGYDGPVALMSFNPHSVLKMAILCPDIPRGLTTSSYTQEDWKLLPKGIRDRLRDIPDYDHTGSCFISHEANDLNRPRVTDLKRRGAAVLCWTIRSPEAEAEARKIAQNVTFEGYLADNPA